MKHKLITIITPTFNRASELKKLYQSLLKQTSQNFIWLVIDDGSIDNTQLLIESYKLEGKLEIDYYFQENKGKHVALNTIFGKIKTEIFLIVDSDDILLSNAIDRITNDWLDNNNESLIGITYLKGFNEKDVIGNKFKNDDFIGTYIGDRINKSIEGDKAEVWKSALFRTYKFPEFPNEKFLGEALLWIQVAKAGQILFKNDIVYIAKYLEKGLSKNGRKLRIQNPFGGMAHANEFLIPEVGLNKRIKHAILFGTYSIFSSKKFLNNLSSSKDKLLVFLVYPFSLILHFYWDIKYLKKGGV